MRDGDVIEGGEILREGLFLDEHEYYPVAPGGQLRESRRGGGNEAMRGAFAEHVADLGLDLDTDALTAQVAEEVAHPALEIGSAHSPFDRGEVLEGLDPYQLAAQMRWEARESTAAGSARAQSRRRRPVRRGEIMERLGLLTHEAK